MSKTLFVAVLVAMAEARFGQEQIPVAAVQALSDFGNPGDAGTLSGQVPGVLLAAANPCAKTGERVRNTPKQNTSADDISPPNKKLELADKIVATLGNDDAVVAAAAGLVAAEQNFNPFAVAIPSICADAGLPATPELQGIVPLVDPDVVGAEVENANSARSLQAPLAAAGAQSVADIVAANGFSNFTAVAADGSQVAVAAGANAGAGAGAAAGAAAGAGAGAGAAAGKANAGGKAAAGGANKVQCGN